MVVFSKLDRPSTLKRSNLLGFRVKIIYELVSSFNRKSTPRCTLEIKVLLLSVKNHLVKRHLADKHIADKYLADRHLTNRHLVDKPFGQLILGQETFGL
jgi:hypothetical protein